MKKGISITIFWEEETGKIDISGPMVEKGSNIFDEPTTFWLLDKAKDMIKLHNKKINYANRPQIVTPN